MTAIWHGLGVTVLVFLVIVFAPVVFVGLVVGFALDQTLGAAYRGLRRMYRA